MTTDSGRDGQWPSELRPSRQKEPAVATFEPLTVGANAVPQGTLLHHLFQPAALAAREQPARMHNAMNARPMPTVMACTPCQERGCNRAARRRRYRARPAGSRLRVRVIGGWSTGRTDSTASVPWPSARGTLGRAGGSAWNCACAGIARHPCGVSWAPGRTRSRGVRGAPRRRQERRARIAPRMPSASGNLHALTGGACG